jgi:hypothetical protein
MPKSWSQYQEDAAAFFRTLGLTADVEKRIEGARGAHDIDVWVTGKLQAFSVRWVVECKDWKANVPKEKVLALQSITADVGADRAFLLSEKGFQSGAIRCAKHTNITLTSLQDLRETVDSGIVETTIRDLLYRCQEAHHLASIIPGKLSEDGDTEVDGATYDTALTLQCLTDMLARRARRNEYPILYHGPMRHTPDDVWKRQVVDDNDLISFATVILQEAEPFVTKRLGL